MARKRQSNFVTLKVDRFLTLSTLADNIALDGALLDLNDDLVVISADLSWAIRGGTAGEGPIEVGLSSSAYSVTQITEAIDASPSNRADEVALERTRRRVRSVGQFPVTAGEEVLFDGAFKRARKLYWKFASDVDLNIWAVNRSGATLTTGMIVHVTGRVYARWT